MLEQLNIRKAELSSRIIRGKSEESAQDSVIRTQTGQLDTANEAIKKLTEQIEQGNAEVVRLKEQIATGSSEIDKNSSSITGKSPDWNRLSTLRSGMTATATVSVKSWN